MCHSYKAQETELHANYSNLWFFCIRRKKQVQGTQGNSRLPLTLTRRLQSTTLYALCITLQLNGDKKNNKIAKENYKKQQQQVIHSILHCKPMAEAKRLLVDDGAP